MLWNLNQDTSSDFQSVDIKCILLFSLSLLENALVDLNMGAGFRFLLQIGCLNWGVAMSSFLVGFSLWGKFLKIYVSMSHAVWKCVYVDSDGPDQNAPMRSLIWAFTVHFQPWYKRALQIILSLMGFHRFFLTMTYLNVLLHFNPVFNS